MAKFTAKSKSAQPKPDMKARATQQLAKGRLKPAQAAKLRHRADVVLGESDSHYHNKG